MGLQDAAEEGALYLGSMKSLNAGLSGTALGHLITLVPFLGGGGPALPLLIGTWALNFGATTLNLLAKDE